MAQPLVLKHSPAKQVEQVDLSGDFLFRFRLKPVDSPETLTLQEMYRQQLSDLLQIVRLYHRGEPIIVDEFAFLDAPDERMRIIANGRRP